MGKEMRMIYDDEGDVLDVSIGVPIAAVSREMDDDFFVRIEPNSGEVVGFSILNFKKWFKNSKDEKVLPLIGTLSLQTIRLSSDTSRAQ